MKVVDLNIRALHYFTKKFAQRFCENKSGRIINIASIASFLPGPLFANYYASKAYVLSYSSAFNSELKYMKSPIRIVTICPGFLKTSFFMHSNNIGQSPYLPSVKPEIFAHKSLHRALLTKNKNYILVGTFTKICWFLNLFIPKKLSLKIIYK
jgi:short-subunit dehydrogenase